METNTNKKVYHTKQRDLIMSLLTSRLGEKITVEEMLDLLNKENQAISKATIYRNLDYLVSVGVIKRIMLDNNCSCYIYEDSNSDSIIHFCCDSCGNIIPINSPSFTKLNSKLQKEYDFTIDQSKTVIHGLCNNCKVGHSS